MPFSLRGFFRKLLRKTNRKDKERLSAEERLALLRSYQQKFKWHGSDLSVAGEAPTDFTTIADLQKALSREDVEKLLQLSPDYQKASLDLIYARLLRVIGILIKIDWCNWEDFPGIFLEKNKRNIWDVHAKRADDSLPFELADLRFLEPPEWQRLFYERQFSFAPVLIIEDKFDTYTSSQRLPFKSCDFEAGGAYGDVYKVVIARSCIRCTKGTLAGDRNNKERLMARKVSKGGEASLEAEKEMQDLLKRGSAESKCIQLSFATFLHGSTLNILYPWADLDLFQFLHGNYVGFSERAAAFTPFLILEQMMLLAGGLHFIHQELFPNEEVQCAHLDFKPENILVFWPDDSLFERRPKKKSTLKPSVGTWKISDFGISRTRQNARPQVHTLYPPDQVVDAKRDRSSMDAPRKAGPYQPPEARDGGRVSWSTDMWSFGCVACVALGFIIGGPRKVFELDRARLSDGNDYFWTAHLPNEYIVKPQILNWLDEEQSKASPEHKSWIQRYIHMIQRLLQVDKKSRPSAAEVRSELNTNWKLAEYLSNTWTPPTHDPFVEKTSEPDQHEFTPSSFGVPSDIDIEGDSPVQRTPSPQHLSQYLVPTEGSRRVAELVPSSRRSTEIVRAGPSLSGLSQPSRPWPAIPNSTWYARLDTPTNTFQSKLSPTAETVAFCSKESVYVYDLQKILNARQLWQETAQHGREGFNEGLKRYHASTGRSWTSVSLAGSFMALCSKVDNDDSPDSVVVHNWQIESIEDNIPPKVIPIDKGCSEIKLSSKGAVLLMFNNRLVMHIDDQAIEPDAFANSHMLQATSFSTNGQFLCVWYKTVNGTNCWCIYLIEPATSSTPATVTRQSYQHTNPVYAPELDKPFRSQTQILIPFNNHSRFIACDRYGQVHLLRHDGPKNPEACNDYVTDAYAGTTLVNDRTLMILCNSPGRQYSTVDIGALIPGNGRESVELLSSWARLDRIFHDDQCGIAVLAEGSHHTLLTAFRDGCVVRQAFRHWA